MVGSVVGLRPNRLLCTGLLHCCHFGMVADIRSGCELLLQSDLVCDVHGVHGVALLLLLAKVP
jgi:hypothetical protein